MKIETITKTFNSALQAEEYYMLLCNAYNRVTLSQAPFTGGSGVYQWVAYNV